MGLESGVSKLVDLNASWPLGTDERAQGDNHLRNIKVALRSLLNDINQIGLGPASLSGQAGKALKVNAGETAYDLGIFATDAAIATAVANHTALPAAHHERYTDGEARIACRPYFVDRGAASNYDWTQASLVQDNTWHDLDLSAIVPTGASAVLLRLVMAHNSIEAVFFRKNGIATDYNISSVMANVSGVSVASDLIVGCDANRVIEYKFSAPGFMYVGITVGGWWM